MGTVDRFAIFPKWIWTSLFFMDLEYLNWIREKGGFLEAVTDYRIEEVFVKDDQEQNK